MCREFFHALARACLPRNRSKHRQRMVSAVPGVRCLSKHHHLSRFSLLLCWMLLICGVGMVVQHTDARAASPSLPPGYSLTVTESTSTMTYGGTAPSFQAQLTVPAGENPLRNPALFNFVIDSQSYSPDASGSSGSTYTFTLKSRTVTVLLVPAGQHAVVASYFSIPLNETLESAPITLTVKKLTPTVYCQLNLLNPFAVSAPVTFTMSSSQGGDPAVDWQDATYSITFVGAQTFTDSNLTADSSGQGTALTPPVPGMYTYQCTFHGTANFNPAQTGFGSTLVVSEDHQPTIKFYSNPTTIKGGETATLEIVVSGGPGLPAPTGQFSLFMGNSFTHAITLGPDGRAEVQITFPSPLPANTIEVNYFGDTVYNQSNARFSLTNPPIPTGSNPSNPTPTPISTATPTPTPVGGSTPAPSSTPIANSGTTSANGGTTSGRHPTGSPSNQGNPVFWIMLLELLVLAAGGSGIFIVLRKRARAARAPATTTFPPGWGG